ncbi:MAG TPA: GGDEF domain-containing protein [Aquabacterium sp.]|nr:GGDEF domain-containing protein [Aquabacterium sp.]
MLCRLFGWAPGQATSQAEIFIRTMTVVAVAAGAVHVVFLTLFAALGMAELAFLNIASVMVYVVAFLFIRKRPFLMEALMGLEICLHGFIAVRFIGWESGFHFYIMLVVPIALVSGGVDERTVRWVRWIWGLGGALLYLVLDARMRHAHPLYELPQPVMSTLRTFNLANMFVLLGVLATVYRDLLLQAESVLRHQACTDPLTQLANRRSILGVLQHEAAAFGREGRRLSVIMADVDHFKAINDKHGHHAGDGVLQAVARVCQATVRQMDHVARWGGEEFLVVLPNTDLSEALLVAERLRAQTAAQVCQSNKGLIPVTMTLGVTEMRDGDSVDQLISRADQALYEGKQNGRNRVQADGFNGIPA